MSSVRFVGATKQYANGFVAVQDLNLSVEDGELLVVVGPSGCGKTTTLRMLAGLEDITEGEVMIGDRVVNNVTARNRDIAMVFQSYALYPHLTVAGNLGYPLKLARVSKAERAERVRTVASQLRLTDLLDRKPRQLSGGQRQRVAMGRAMVRNPRVFLMDEPLSNLDAKLRVVMRAEVAELQRSLGTTMFYVTHDQVEAMTMGHRVAVMNEGVLQQVAPPAELYNKPANLFVASFIGSPAMNLAMAHVTELDGGAIELRSGGVTIAVDAAAAARHADLRRNVDRDVVLGVRPEHVELSGEGISGAVRLVEMLGSESLVHVDVPGIDPYRTGATDPEAEPDDTNRWTVKVHGDVSVRLGDPVALTLPAEHLHIFDPDEG